VTAGRPRSGLQAPELEVEVERARSEQKVVEDSREF
jgi:hypothetical protein